MKGFVRTAVVVGAAMLLNVSASLAFIQAPDLLQGSWANQLTGGGASTWTFAPLGGGRYDAQEAGMGNARGTAVLTGKHLHIDFVTGPVVGAYDVDLSTSGADGTGQVSFSEGPLTGNIYRTAFRRVGGLPSRPAAGVPQLPRQAGDPGDLPEALKPHGGASAGQPAIAPLETEPFAPPVVIGVPLDPPKQVTTEDPDAPAEPAPGPPG
jgi:hypothetical protein